MAIQFLAGEGFAINDLAGSGLGFYGPGGFGSSIKVGAYNQNGYISDATGSVQGPKIDNIARAASTSGELPGGDIRLLRAIPNHLATLNIRATHASPVQTMNAKLRAYDRVNRDAPPSGWSVYLAELIHPWTSASPAGSGSLTWVKSGGSGGTYGMVTYDAPLSLVDSPGSGGLRPSGAATVDTTHDWFVAISVSPDSNGTRLAAVEFLYEYV